MLPLHHHHGHLSNNSDSKSGRQRANTTERTSAQVSPYSDLSTSPSGTNGVSPRQQSGDQRQERRMRRLRRRSDCDSFRELVDKMSQSASGDPLLLNGQSVPSTACFHGNGRSQSVSADRLTLTSGVNERRRSPSPSTKCLNTEKSRGVTTDLAQLHRNQTTLRWTPGGNRTDRNGNDNNDGQNYINTTVPPPQPPPFAPKSRLLPYR